MTAPSPRPAYWAGLAIGGGVLTIWLGVLFSMRFLLESSSAIGPELALDVPLVLLPQASPPIMPWRTLSSITEPLLLEHLKLTLKKSM